MLKTITDYFNNKQPVERYFLLFIFALAILTSVWLVIIQPIHADIEAKKEKLDKIASFSENLQNLSKDTARELTELKNSQGNSIDINIAIEQSAKAHKITITESKTAGNVINITVKEVAFAHFNNWIAELHTRYSIKVDNMSIYPINNQPGKVEVRSLTLSKTSI